MLSGKKPGGDREVFGQEAISYELLRTLAAEAWDLGDMNRAAWLAAHVDAAMLRSLQQDEGREVGADKVPLIVPADRA